MTLWTLISWVIMIQNGPDWIISSKYNTCRPKHQAMVQEDGLTFTVEHRQEICTRKNDNSV